MSHIVELLAVGTELLLGNIANTDAQMLSLGLSELGLNVFYHTVVGDNPRRVEEAVSIAKQRADIIITTGGLGPTCDDLTKQVVAEAYGRKLEFNEDCAQSIRDFFAHSQMPMTENNLQQAWLPEDCTVLNNRWGTAPGCAFREGDNYVVMLPGPPSECIPMFREEAAPWLLGLSEGIIRSRTLRIFGKGESEVESMLRDRMNELTNPTLAPYAKEGEVELRITAKASSPEEAEALIVPVEAEVRALLGDLVYGADVPSLEQVVLGLLKEQGKTLGTAESRTGGLIAKRITDLSGASSALKGGIVSYANEVKINVLGVSPVLLKEQGAVCAQVAAQMAQGAKKALGCDLAVSATGVAGPDSDDWGNPVGLVYVALTDGKQTWVRKLELGGRIARRDRIRTLSANHALDMVRRYLTGLEIERR